MARWLSGVKMLLQVHDELVFEFPAEVAHAAVVVIKRVMNGTAVPAAASTMLLVVKARAAGNRHAAR